MKKRAKKGPRPGQTGYQESLGGRIRAARSKRRLSLAAVGKWFDIGGPSVWQWEVNETAPQAERLEVLQRQFPELIQKGTTPLKDSDTFPGEGGLDVGKLDPQKLRIMADLLEQRQQINSKLRELSEEPTPARPKRP